MLAASRKQAASHGGSIGGARVKSETTEPAYHRVRGGDIRTAEYSGSFYQTVGSIQEEGVMSIEAAGGNSSCHTTSKTEPCS